MIKMGGLLILMKLDWLRLVLSDSQGGLVLDELVKTSISIFHLTFKLMIF